MKTGIFHGHGFLLLNKPAGITSAKAIQPFKKMCSGKVGHVGTLDPFATGMLALSIGQATKFASLQLKASKKYVTCIQLGTQTDSQDITGKILKEMPVPALTKEKIYHVLQQYFTGDIMQVPSKFSALKYQGKPYHFYARQGIEIPIQARPVTIYENHLEHFDASSQKIHLTVTCSSGTYIRALAEDIAEKLGTCGFVASLHRSYISPWIDAPLHDPEAISPQNIADHLQNTDSVLQNYTAITLSQKEIEKLQMGQSIPKTQEKNTEILRIYNEEKQFFGLAEYHHNLLKAKKILVSKQS